MTIRLHATGAWPGPAEQWRQLPPREAAALQLIYGARLTQVQAAVALDATGEEMRGLVARGLRTIGRSVNSGPTNGLETTVGPRNWGLPVEQADDLVQIIA